MSLPKVFKLQLLDETGNKVAEWLISDKANPQVTYNISWTYQLIELWQQLLVIISTYELPSNRPKSETG